jgi:hypothetical protein
MKTGYLLSEDGSLPWMLYVVPQEELPPLYVAVKLVSVCAEAGVLNTTLTSSPRTTFTPKGVFLMASPSLSGGYTDISRC